MSVRVAVRPNAGRNAPRYFGMPAAAGIIKTLPDSLTGYNLFLLCIAKLFAEMYDGAGTRSGG